MQNGTKITFSASMIINMIGMIRIAGYFMFKHYTNLLSVYMILVNLGIIYLIISQYLQYKDSYLAPFKLFVATTIGESFIHLNIGILGFTGGNSGESQVKKIIDYITMLLILLYFFVNLLLMILLMVRPTFESLFKHKYLGSEYEIRNENVLLPTQGQKE